MTQNPESSTDYLETLEQVKGQYQQYVEISKIFDLPTRKNEKPAPPISVTTNTFALTI